MIQVDHITKRYGPVEAVSDVSFEVQRGEILGFLGPNGAGKTTTMRILTGFFPPTSGTAVVAGYDILKEPLKARARIGYLPENVPLYNDLTVREYLTTVAAIKGVPARDQGRSFDQMVDLCGLQDVKDRLIGHISRGFRQRVGLAQALVNDPEVLILDEPTVGLDPRQIIEIRSLIKSLAGERTVILSTHILPEAAMTCQRVVIINRGKVVAVDTPENLDSQLMQHQQIQVVVEGPTAEVQAALETIPGVKRVEISEVWDQKASLVLDSERGVDIRPEIAPLVTGKGWKLLELKSMALSLEDIFLRLVTREEGAEQ